MKNTGKKVFVGLSGGVDSSVSAALLKEQGYDVVGVFIKVWTPLFLPCTWKDERRDAMRVAAHLNIPFLTFDFEKEYKKSVVDYMVSGYKDGLVPNPDVMCNKEIKFGAFLKKALEMGADYVATGHYARIEYNLKNGDTGNIELLKGVDDEKDQSYFLWTLKQEQLHRSLFPIGGYKKSYVRELAQKFRLPTAEKKDSQGVCFLGKLDMKDFLKHYIKEKTGDVLDVDGNRIGTHDGAYFYAIGQRHGFNIIKKSVDELPYFVIAKDLKANTITVAHKQKIEEFSKGDIEISDINWISSEPEENYNYRAKIRYRQNGQNCIFKKHDGKTSIMFKEQQNVSRGQSIVLYDGDICLGGGVVV